MKWWWWALVAIALAACGETAAERDPECEAQADTAWACSRERSATRSRCVAGRYEEDTCAAGTWCLPTVAAGGACLDKQLDSACPNGGEGPCPDGLVCYLRVCREPCETAFEQTCKIEGQRCRNPGDGTSPVCLWQEEGQWPD